MLANVRITSALCMYKAQASQEGAELEGTVKVSMIQLIYGCLYYSGFGISQLKTPCCYYKIEANIVQAQPW